MIMFEAKHIINRNENHQQYERSSICWGQLTLKSLSIFWKLKRNLKVELALLLLPKKKAHFWKLEISNVICNLMYRS